MVITELQEEGMRPLPLDKDAPTHMEYVAHWQERERRYKLAIVVPLIDKGKIQPRTIEAYLQIDPAQQHFTYVLWHQDVPLATGQLRQKANGVLFKNGSDLRVTIERESATAAPCYISHVQATGIELIPLEEIVEGADQRRVLELEGRVKALEGKMTADANSLTTRLDDLERRLGAYGKEIRDLGDELAALRKGGVATKTEGEDTKPGRERSKQGATSILMGEVPDEVVTVTTERDRVVYSLAQALMNHLVKEGRYRADDHLGLGPWGIERSRLVYVPFEGTLMVADNFKAMAGNVELLALADEGFGATHQFYYKKVAEFYEKLFELDYIGRNTRLPAPLVLLAQITALGSGPAKSVERVSERLGFSIIDLLDKAVAQNIFAVNGNGLIPQPSFKRGMCEIYGLWMKERKNLYHQ